jgi:hypothetical protein
MNVNVVGRRLEGKTTLALWRCRMYAAKVIWDPRGMISGVIVSTPDDLEIAIEEKEWRNGPIVYRAESGDISEEFSGFCGVLFPPKFTRGGFAVLVDEAGELQTAHGINPNLLRAIKQHPTHPASESVLLVQTNHRLAEFHNSSKALMDELYIFQTTLPGDLRVLEEHTGIPEISNIVRNLPKHQCVKYLYGRQQAGVPQYTIMDDPSVWYTPLKGGLNAPDDSNGLDTNELPHGEDLPQGHRGASARNYLSEDEREEEIYGR